MSYMVVCTLKRGTVLEPCSVAENMLIEAAERTIQIERDPELTIEELWLMQCKQCGFYRNGKRRKETA